MILSLAATSASALEFGQISLTSHLNQPLAARIVLSSLSASERDSLDVRIASPDMFERFGIERSSEVDNLDVSSAPGSPSNDVVVEIRTSRPVREPFVDFLLEASTSHGSAVREYTVLLNPAGSGQDKAAAASGKPAADRAAPATAPAAGSSSRGASSASAVSNDRDPGSYGPVAAGETLFSIADRLRPSGITVAQMEVAFFDANPQAFSGGMSRLRRGATLTVPATDAVRRIVAADASQRTRADALADSQPVASPTQNKSADAAVTETAPPPTERSTTPNVSKTAAKPPVANEDTAAQPAFGRLSMPRSDAWSAVSVQPSAAAASAPAAAVDMSADAAVPNKNAAHSNAASTDVRALSPVDTQSVANDDAEPDIALSESTNLAVSGVAAAAEENAEPVMDVSESGDAGLLSPRNLLLGLLLVVLGAAAVVWRRRQYRPVVFDLDNPDWTADVPPSAPGALEQSGKTMYPAAQDEPQGADQPDDMPRQPSAGNTAFVGPPVIAAGGIEADTTDASESASFDGFLDETISDGRRRADAPADGLSGTTHHAAASRTDDLESEALAVADPADRRAPEHTGSPSSVVNDLGITDGDTSSDDMAQAYDFIEQPLPETGTREHDQAEHPGMSFELPVHTSASDENTAPAVEPQSSDDAEAENDLTADKKIDDLGGLEMIDPTSLAGYGIEGESSNDGDPVDSNTVEIRLDLARMYMEMEDEAMARDLLAEVVANGDDVQQREAQSLLETM